MDSKVYVSLCERLHPSTIGGKIGVPTARALFNVHPNHSEAHAVCSKIVDEGLHSANAVARTAWAHEGIHVDMLHPSCPSACHSSRQKGVLTVASLPTLLRED